MRRKPEIAEAEGIVFLIPVPFLAIGRRARLMNPDRPFTNIKIILTPVDPMPNFFMYIMCFE